MSFITFLIQFYKDFNKDIRRAELYIMSPDWIVNKKATTKPKNEKDNRSFHWSITSGLNYNKIIKKIFEKNRKIKMG